MRVKNAINYDDLRRLARRRLAKIAFDFIEGGVDDEDGLTRNALAFRQFRLVPKYFVDVTRCDQTTTLFGRSYASPFGIAPTGGASLFRHGADVMLARAARDAKIPFVISGASSASMEEVADRASEECWYQLYVANNRKIAEDMIRRANGRGFPVLVLTVDVPNHPKRERNLRNGFARPLKPSLAVKLEALLHPGWLADYVRYGQPKVSNWEPYAPSASDAKALLAFFSTQMPCSTTWADVERFRRLWPRTLVMKGIMHPDDAARAAALGVDGIIVSNHGGRQLDRAPSPLEVFPAIRAAVGEKVTLMLDSGIRRGSDIVTALCLGAKFVFVGRWTLYGVVAGGEVGARHAVDMMRKEIATIMGQIGATDIKCLGPHYIMECSPRGLKDVSVSGWHLPVDRRVEDERH
jgi:L-lactate dehydrogenase (cytochrome)/(S)-mandelate dehydrogenase